jgi:hypothetical protein
MRIVARSMVPWYMNSRFVIAGGGAELLELAEAAFKEQARLHT